MSVTPVQPQIRLALSRARLGQAMHQLHAKSGTGAASHTERPAWWEALRAEPGTRVLLDTLAVWWARQPWQQSTALLAVSASQLLRPLAQRYPVALVLGAAVLGGSLVMLKPWRWISVPALAAGLLPGLLAKLASQLRPISWADLLNSWLQAGDKDMPAP
jgi:hypothetical protein